MLCQDGIVRFINITTCKLLFDVGTIDNKINSAAVSPNGRHLVAVMEDGCLNVYNLHVMSAEINKVRILVCILKNIFRNLTFRTFVCIFKKICEM